VVASEVPELLRSLGLLALTHLVITSPRPTGRRVILSFATSAHVRSHWSPRL